MLGGISFWQLAIVLAIVVLIFGTKKLRNVGGDLGGAIRNFKSAMKEGEAQAHTHMHTHRRTCTCAHAHAHTHARAHTTTAKPTISHNHQRTCCMLTHLPTHIHPHVNHASRLLTLM